MRKSTRRDLLRGILSTVAAAAGFAVLFGIAKGAFREGTLDGIAVLALAVGYGLLVSAWFVMPIGIDPRFTPPSTGWSAKLGGVEASDLALVTTVWSFTGTGLDGEPVKLAAKSADVLRRQVDGSWRFLIDNPWGTD